MKRSFEIEKVGVSRYINYQPGNATRYDVYITPSFDNPDIVVVSIPNLNMSFCINTWSTLAWGYVFEKISVGGRRGHECDASAITALLSEVLDVPARVHTDDEGRWSLDERWINEPESKDV